MEQMENVWLLPSITMILLLLVLLIAPSLSHAAGSTEVHELPLLVGPHAFGAKPIEETVRNSVGNFVWIPKWKYSLGTAEGYSVQESGWGMPGPFNYHFAYRKDEATLAFLESDMLRFAEEAAKRQLYFMISVRRGLSDQILPGGYGLGGDSSSDILTEDITRKVRDVAGEYFIGLHMEEMDIDFIQSGLVPKSYNRQGYGNVFKYETRQQARERFEEHFSNLINRYESWGVTAIPNMSITFQHYAYRAGANIIIAEVLEHLPTVDLQLAYLRGAYTQNGKPWGVWVSPWLAGSVPTDDPSLWVNKDAPRIGGGHSRFSFERCLYMSYYSGASIITQQETEAIFTDLDKDTNWELGEWGKELQKFYKFTQQYPETGDSTSRVAILIHLDAGWAPGRLWGYWDKSEKGYSVDTVWAKWDAEKPDYMMTFYLDRIYPHYQRSGTSPDAIYPGYFVSTPIGPVDVIMTDASVQQLGKYAAILYLGYSEMSTELLERLASYVESGGTLLLNAGQLKDVTGSIINSPEFLGAILTDKISTSQLVKTSAASGVLEQDKVFVETRYALYEADVVGGSVLATDERQRPVLIENDYGNGKVYLTTPQFLISGSGTSYRPMKFAQSLIDNVVKANQEVVLDTLGDVSYMVTTLETGDKLIVLVNHGRVSWSGRVSVKGTSIKHIDVLREDEGMRANICDAGIELELPGETVTVLRLTLQDD